MSVRLVAAVWTVVLLVALAVAAWLLVPRGPIPQPSPGLLREVFTAAEIERGDAFAARVRPPSYLALAVGLVVAVWLTLTRRGLSLLRRMLRGPRWLHVPEVVVVVLGAGWLVTLPFDAWEEQGLRDYGLSTQSWGMWLLDGLKGLGLSAGLTSLGLMLLVWLAGRLPRWWFLPASVGAAVLTLAMSFAYPVLVEPVFNSFTPMREGELRTTLLRMAQRDGVHVDDVLVADASRRTTSLNAYVSGLGATRRIVVYDNLLRESTPREVKVIVAHELGHDKADDVLIGSTLSALGGAVGLTLLWWVLRSRWTQRRGVRGPDDPLAAAVVLGLATTMTVVMLPVTNAISRQVEIRADRHALELSREPETIVRMQRRLALTNLSDLTPPRWVYAAFFSHPSALERVELAQRWREER